MLYCSIFARTQALQIYTHTFGLCPCFWHTAPKILGISCDKSNKSVFCYVNEVTFRKYLWLGGLVAWGPNLVSRGLELSGPTPDLWGG